MFYPFRDASWFELASIISWLFPGNKKIVYAFFASQDSVCMIVWIDDNFMHATNDELWTEWLTIQTATRSKALILCYHSLVTWSLVMNSSREEFRRLWPKKWNDDMITLYVASWLAPLQRRHNGCDGVSNHQPHDCLFNRLFRRISKKTSKLRFTGLCEGNSPVTGEFPTQRASNAENASIWWRHHAGANSLRFLHPQLLCNIRHDQISYRISSMTNASSVALYVR